MLLMVDFTGPMMQPVHDVLAEAYSDSARCLVDALHYALGSVDPAEPTTPVAEPVQRQRAAADSARRLDDADRTCLAERGTKPLSLADMTALVTGVAVLRLAADAVVSLWRHAGPTDTTTDQFDARRAVLGAASRVMEWYCGFAASLGRKAPVPDPAQLRPESAARLVESVRTDLVDGRGQATATAVRVIWTGDHVDVARRLQPGLVAAAQGNDVR
ncbi:hypothetical protein GCM10011578_087840 [Streptomyces fuscichromogenes]|uniref:Uncharacterized protein n=2 Tax=Streptomyces fuscichromogenes TaxID=1324013 RepID=A0A917XNG5_9ACTN|nr:hypothetical protein GCM10011578_087840 [Streptomyces fuscichromogenes]